MTRLRASTLALGALLVVASACGTQPKAKHDREVVKTTTLPGTNTWPGDRAVAKLADSTCRAAFKKYVGISYNKSDLQVDFITTVKEDWQEGFRTAVCLVFDPDHKTIKHSLRGSRT